MVGLRELANIAVILGATVSSITLVIVGIDYYKTHLQVKRSGVEFSPLSRDTRISGTKSKFRITLPIQVTNHGERDALFNPGALNHLEIPGQCEGKYWQGEEIENVNVNVKRVDENRVPPESNLTGQIRVIIREEEDIARELASSSRCEVSVSIPVEDNEGQYQVEYTDTVEIGELNW